MRARVLTIVIALMFAWTGSAWAGLTAQSSVDDVLDALDARGQGLEAFTADVHQSDTDAATGDSQTRIGKVWYQGGDSPRIRVTFDKRQVNNKKITDEKVEYLLVGGNLIDRNYQKKMQTTRKILKPGEKLNLFKLGEGQFPLPIGQKKEDVHANFDVTKIDAKKDDPADTVHLQLKPKAGSKFAEKFKSIDVWAGLSDSMPRRIETLDGNETTDRTTDLSNVVINPKLSDADFTLSKVTEDEWQLREEAFNPRNGKASSQNPSSSSKTAV